MHYNTGGAQAAGAGAVILIVMQVINLPYIYVNNRILNLGLQFFWVVLFGSTEDSAVYQFVYSGSVLPVSQNGVGNIHGSPKESKIALSSPEANSQYSHHNSIGSIHTPIQHTNPPSTPNSTVMQPQAPIHNKNFATALHPCQSYCIPPK